MGFNDPQTFELTADHIKLIRNMWVGYNDYTESGAPEIDPKRPYGNSDVPGDVCDILGWEFDRDEDIPEELEERAWKIHRETEKALQVFVRCATIEPGHFQTEMAYDQNWSRV